MGPHTSRGWNPREAKSVCVFVWSQVDRRAQNDPQCEPRTHTEDNGDVDMNTVRQNRDVLTGPGFSSSDRHKHTGGDS